MHVRTVLLSQLIREGHQLVQVLVQCEYRILQQFLYRAEVHALLRIPLNYIETYLVQGNHGAGQRLVISLFEQNLN